jgi:quinol monooxygenase YgiN
MADGPFRMIVKQGIKPGKLEELKKMAEGLTSGVETNEPTTLCYEWFISEDGSSCYLIESYGDAEAFLLHFQNLGSKLQEMLEISPLEEMVVVGDPSPQVKEMLAGLGAKFYSLHVGCTR